MKHYQERSFIEQYPLSPKKPLKKTVTKLFGVIPLFFLFGIPMLLIPTLILFEKGFTVTSIFAISIGICIAILVITAAIYEYEKWYARTYFYNITDSLIIIRKGPLAPQEITIPFERIQDIYVDQDILDRLFDLYDVHISTATAQSGVRAHIDGVEKNSAEQLRELLLKKVQEVLPKKY